MAVFSAISIFNTGTATTKTEIALSATLTWRNACRGKERKDEEKIKEKEEIPDQARNDTGQKNASSQRQIRKERSNKNEE